MKIKKYKYYALILLIFSFSNSHAQTSKKSQCSVPLKEEKSSAASDLITKNGRTVDRDELIDLIKSGDKEKLLEFEPQINDFYVKKSLAPVEYNINFPSFEQAVSQPFEFISFGEVEYFIQSKIRDPKNPEIVYNMTTTFDVNAGLCRNALLRKLGYNIPSPKHYPKLSVTFKTLDERNEFLARISRNRDFMPWVDGGVEEYNKNKLTITLLNVALESSILMNIPPMHWGVFKPKNVPISSRSFRSLLVPLTLLDIDESVNMYPFEPVKIENNHLIFSRPFANSFKSETSLGDVEWISRKMAALTVSDWSDIIKAGHFPTNIENLILQKTLGRVNQLMSVVGIKLDINNVIFNPLPNDPYLTNETNDDVINGKAYENHYDGYPQNFVYGDPKNPLRPSELARYFSVELISSGIKLACDKASEYLQIWTNQDHINLHKEKLKEDVIQHLQTNPGTPYVQPLSLWGGPIAGAGVNASRSIVAGTYYGNDSPIQLVDTVSVSARAGVFAGLSGISNVGISFSPTVSYNRSYVHVRPIDDIKSGLKDNWSHVAVPFTMAKLSNILQATTEADTAVSIENFLKELKTGEMLIIINGYTFSNHINIGIPLAAMLGAVGPLSQIQETISGMNQYAISSRTTITKTKDSLHVYTSDIRNFNHEINADTNFFIRLFGITGTKLKGRGYTDAFILPDTLNTDEEKKAYQSGISKLLRRNSSTIIEKNFKPIELVHHSKGKRLKLKLGPLQWTKRESTHRLEITPPESRDGSYRAEDDIRKVVQGQINRISGVDMYGFLGGILNSIYSFINIGGGLRGDDPASNFLGRSKSTIVSTELETTTGYDNKTLLKIQKNYAGWNMNNKKLLKLLDKISNSLHEFNPNGNLIDKNSFVQTKKIQSFNIISTLSIYESGVDKILDVLNSHTMGTKAVTHFLTYLVGQDQLKAYCKSVNREFGFIVGPRTLDQFDSMDHRYVETSQGQTTVINCVMPWMATIFDLRQKLKKHPEIFQKNIHNEDTAIEKIKWLNRSMSNIESYVDLSYIIKWAGIDSIYFQTQVLGYRKGDERAQDEEGRSAYYVNSIGSQNPDVKSGPLDDIHQNSTITEHELNARYLSDGF